MLYSLLVFVYLSPSAVSQCATASWTAWWELLLLSKTHILGSALRARAKLIPLSTCSDHSGSPRPCVFHCHCVTSLEWASQTAEDTRMITSGKLKLVRRTNKLRENWIQDQVHSRSEKDFLGGGIAVIGFVFEKVGTRRWSILEKKNHLFGFYNQVLCKFFSSSLSLFEHGMRLFLCAFFLTLQF